MAKKPLTFYSSSPVEEGGSSRELVAAEIESLEAAEGGDRGWDLLDEEIAADTKH